MPRIKKHSEDEPTQMTPEMLQHLEYLARTAQKRSNGAATSTKKSGTNICIDCQKAVLGCNWSRSFQPVEGWTAEITALKISSGVYMETYWITACPEFEMDLPRKNTTGALTAEDSDRFLENPIAYLDKSNTKLNPALDTKKERDPESEHLLREKEVRKDITTRFNKYYTNGKRRRRKKEDSEQ